jgi:hypothetical protein
VLSLGTLAGPTVTSRGTKDILLFEEKENSAKEVQAASWFGLPLGTLAVPTVTPRGTTKIFFFEVRREGDLGKRGPGCFLVHLSPRDVGGTDCHARGTKNILLFEREVNSAKECPWPLAAAANEMMLWCILPTLFSSKEK